MLNYFSEFVIVMRDMQNIHIIGKNIELTTDMAHFCRMFYST